MTDRSESAHSKRLEVYNVLSKRTLPANALDISRRAIMEIPSSLCYSGFVAVQDISIRVTASCTHSAIWKSLPEIKPHCIRIAADIVVGTHPRYVGLDWEIGLAIES